MHPLYSFSGEAPAVQLKAGVEFTGTEIICEFVIGDPQRIVLDSLEAGRWSGADLERAHGLWKTTCFEAFWGVPGDKGYWELNAAGSGGRWNIYHFTDYRQPQPPAESQDHSMIEIVTTQNKLRCVFRRAPGANEFEFSMCAVIRTASGVFYYSTKHAGAKPDFHNRASFLIGQ